MTVVRFEYNPMIDIRTADTSSLEWMNGEVIGAYRVNDRGVVEWKYIAYENEKYSSFIDDLIPWLESKGFKSGVLAKGIDYNDCLISLEASYLKWWFKEHKDVPLVKHDIFKLMVEMYLTFIPEEYQPHTGHIDLSDTINETGLSDIDIHSVNNMLSHFHDEHWVTKAERMTIIAYNYSLDIHPLAIALTPNIVGAIRNGTCV